MNSGGIAFFKLDDTEHGEIFKRVVNWSVGFRLRIPNLQNIEFMSFRNLRSRKHKRIGIIIGATTFLSLN